MSLTLLHPEPLPRPDLEDLRQTLAFAFASGVSGGLFAQALDKAPLPESTFRPASFAADLFLEELVARCFRVRVNGYEAMIHRGFLLRVLSQPPADARVTEHRRAVLHELATVPAFRRDLESLYVLSCRLRTALEGATVGKKFDGARRQLDVLALVKETFDRMSASFEGARCGLSRLREYGLAVQAGEPYRSMTALLDYDEHLATLSLAVRVGADGRVRGFDVRDVRERQENPFVLSPARRWLAKIEMVLRGYRFGDGEIMARLLDAVFEGMEGHVLALLPLLGEMEFYLGSLGFRDLAEAAGLSVSLPELRAEDDAPGPRVLLGLFNPLLVANGARPVPCDLRTDRADMTLLVTGPNSGGKTRLLQSAALAQLLGQAGTFVPARAARITVVAGLVVSLIQETRFDQGEGRLGMELLRIRALFEELGPGAMVILDELCSGTNPSEGEEIFELVIRLLARLRPQAFITTHFLTFAARLARERSIAGLAFLQVELDPSHKPTYQFVPGVATTSLASHAATRLGVTRDELDRLIDQSLARRPLSPRPASPPPPPPGARAASARGEVI
jgi:DNA mismatch repair protein MutS2